MSRDDHSSTRRELLQGITTGLVAAVAAPALSQPLNAQATTDRAAGEFNPVTAYPQPPFPQQEQPWPGLTSKMTPLPDHGEKTYRGSGRLSGRKALITGGDSGIGRAVAIAYAREGADVAINYLPAEEADAQQVAGIVRDAGRKFVMLPGDIRDENFCKKLVADAVDRLGGLDIVVNNAARQFAHQSITEISTGQFDDTFKTNVYAMFWITKAAMPNLKPGSTIINTSSVNAYDPGENIIDYAATKAAIMIFSKGLAKQVAKQGIRVNAVAPGPVWTPLQVTGGQPVHSLPEFGKETPLGRAGQPAELASLYVLLASNESSFSTGQVFGAVGGHGGP
jgi:NAD(P)-dependent dehydrogenase (short-subunit alcohol dehydrogenase family)